MSKKKLLRRLLMVSFAIVFATFIVGFSIVIAVTRLIPESTILASEIFLIVAITPLVFALVIWKLSKGWSQFDVIYLEASKKRHRYYKNPSRVFRWRIITYLEVTLYLAIGFAALASGYVRRDLSFLGLSALSLTTGFFILTFAQAHVDSRYYIGEIDLSERPSLQKAIECGRLLLPRWANVGSCNMYASLKPSGDSTLQNERKARTQLQVTLEAAGVTVDGEKTRYQPPEPTWDEVWNCAFLSTGHYDINLKIDSQEANSASVNQVSTIVHETEVAGLFFQTLNPLLLVVIPVVITATVTLMTAKDLHLPW